MDFPAPVREAVLKHSDPETVAALRLVSRSWQDAADQIERRITIRVAADPPPDELPAIAKLLRNLGGRYRKVQEVTVMLSGGDVRPSVTHALASAGACGQQLSVPGAVFADMLEPTLRAVSRARRYLFPSARAARPCSAPPFLLLAHGLPPGCLMMTSM